MYFVNIAPKSIQSPNHFLNYFIIDVKRILSFLDRNTLPLDRRHHVFHNGTLLINKVTRKDTGTYGCTATGRQGASSSQSGHLKVIGT